MWKPVFSDSPFLEECFLIETRYKGKKEMQSTTVFDGTNSYPSKFPPLNKTLKNILDAAPQVTEEDVKQAGYTNIEEYYTLHTYD